MGHRHCGAEQPFGAASGASRGPILFSLSLSLPSLTPLSETETNSQSHGAPYIALDPFPTLLDYFPPRRASRAAQIEGDTRTLGPPENADEALFQTHIYLVAFVYIRLGHRRAVQNRLYPQHAPPPPPWAGTRILPARGTDSESEAGARTRAHPNSHAALVDDSHSCGS